jgi:NAD(P)-dependent dehydrogenase (short-subunit alcohol dehydrogenase family)
MATPYSLTKEGYEIQLGTNHMGHALLTKLLLPTMLETAKQPDADVRVVTLSSAAHHVTFKEGINFDQAGLEKESTWRRYGASKLANILFARELAARNPSITSVAIHPGVIMTDLFGQLATNVFLKIGIWVYGILAMVLPGHFRSAEGGALNSTWCATTKKENLESGAFYRPVGVKNPGSKLSSDPGLQKRLWEWTEAEFSEHGY